MTSPTSEADANLVADLTRLSKNAPKLVKSSTYQAPAVPEMTIRSWKMNEFKYYDVPSPFPTLARGIFTQWVPDSAENKEGDGSGHYRIIARGYDKFFNIGEVPWTTWATLERHTTSPYVLTLKSNGCIIFMAALTPSKLLVTSKHSIGPINGVDTSHAQAGEKWLHKHLGQKGKSVEQFAKVLWDNNWTAVAELCDDNFEEHVLPYTPEKTGLHLHGINNSTGAFQTQPPEVVAAFAREWGFIETSYHTVDSIPEVKAFTDEVSKTGIWKGESVEGFVVRCHVGSARASSNDAHAAPPYPPGSSFFFKVKFDEPYMMYRDWREITKMLLSPRTNRGAVKIPKSKLRRPESVLYRKWVTDEIKRDKTQFEGFTKGKGIIATRERFLRWMQSEQGEQIRGNDVTDKDENSDLNENDKKYGKTIIVPVAIPGCGKTTIAVALRHLFGFGHTQSDDIRAKKAAPVFIRNVQDELEAHDVVIADKNNHLQQHREQLRAAVANKTPPVRLLALEWSFDKPPAMIHRICADRVMDRGDNHQTLHADAVAKNHEEVLWMFIKQYEELAEDEVDEVVGMEYDEDLEQGLDRAIDACVRVLGVRKPSQEDVGRALAAARAYSPATKKGEEKAKKKATKPRYYGFLPEFDLEGVVADALVQRDAPEAAKNFWNALCKNNRVASCPHITIVHSKSLPREKDLWERCHSLFMQASPLMFDFKLGNLVFDDRVMALTVDDVNVSTNAGQDTNEEGREFVSLLEDALRQRLHITVGTREPSIQPFEAGTLVDSWKRDQAGPNFGCIPLKDVVVSGRIKGLYS